MTEPIIKKQKINEDEPIDFDSMEKNNFDRNLTARDCSFCKRKSGKPECVIHTYLMSKELEKYYNFFSNTKKDDKALQNRIPQLLLSFASEYATKESTFKLYQGNIGISFSLSTLKKEIDDARIAAKALLNKDSKIWFYDFEFINSVYSVISEENVMPFGCFYREFDGNQQEFFIIFENGQVFICANNDVEYNYLRRLVKTVKKALMTIREKSYKTYLHEINEKLEGIRQGCLCKKKCQMQLNKI